MARITDALLNPDDWRKRCRPGYVPPELDIPPEDPYASHLYLAYMFYGCPFFCASIGDTMGNAIRCKAMRYHDRTADHAEHVLTRQLHLRVKLLIGVKR